MSELPIMAGHCDCGTKTPDYVEHDKTCKVWLAGYALLLERQVEELENPWVSVDGVENAPEGDWLFLLEDGKQHTGNVHTNLCTVGGTFYFDRPPVVAYAPLPKNPLGSGYRWGDPQ